LWSIDAVGKLVDCRDRAATAGHPREGGPLKRVLGMTADHISVVCWGVAISALCGYAVAFGVRSAATFAGVLLLFQLLWWLLERIWRRIFPTDEITGDRIAHIRALEAERDSPAVSLLGQYLRDPRGPVSRRAAFALADIGSPEAIEELRREIANAATQPVSRWARFALWVVDQGSSAHDAQPDQPS
jgi:hypothetical protein